MLRVMASCTVACANYDGREEHSNPGCLFLGGEHWGRKLHLALGPSCSSCCLCYTTLTPAARGSGLCDAPSVSTRMAKPGVRWLALWLLALVIRVIGWFLAPLPSYPAACPPRLCPAFCIELDGQRGQWGPLTQGRAGFAEAAGRGEANAVQGTLRDSNFKVDLRWPPFWEPIFFFFATHSSHPNLGFLE